MQIGQSLGQLPKGTGPLPDLDSPLGPQSSHSLYQTVGVARDTVHLTQVHTPIDEELPQIVAPL